MTESVNLSTMVADMTHLFEAAVSRKAELRIDIAADLPTIEGDPALLREMIMNLIRNASRSLDGGDGRITVRTGVIDADRTYLVQTYLGEGLEEGHYASVEVSDTGSGMDRETQERAFEPFFKGGFGGRGLGLATVMETVRSHMGAIKLYSELGQGTRFRIFFPCQPPSGERAAGGDNDAIRTLREGGTVLVIDDEEIVRAVTVQVLEGIGFRALTAVDGQNGVDMFQAHAEEIDVVLLDMTMPYLSGEEVFREIKQVREDVVVILSSGYDEQDAYEQFTEKGIAGFLQKPYRAQDLVRRLQEVLPGSR